MVRLQCHALTADRRAARPDPHAECTALLGYTPTAVRFVNTAARAPTHPDGHYWVRCARCKAWNVFEACAE